MKNILIPIDFSESSLNAIAYGQLLFKNEETTFYLFSALTHKHSNLIGDEWGNEWDDGILEDVEQETDDFILNIEKTNKNKQHHFNAITTEDAFIDATVKLVLTLEIDFIVMATKGAKGLREVFLGSNAVRVINKIDECPTIFVPKDYTPSVPIQIVFSTDFKRPFNINELDALLFILKTMNSKLKIVQLMEEDYLSEKQKLHKEALIYLLGDIPHFFHKITYESSETEAIRNFVEQTQSGMISFIHHKQNFFYKLTNENVVEKTTFNSPIPVLVLPQKKR